MTEQEKAISGLVHAIRTIMTVHGREILAVIGKSREEALDKAVLRAVASVKDWK